MARNRMVKPQIWSDEKTGTLPDRAKLTFIGMLNFADDEGKLIGSPTYIRSCVFPYSVEDITKEIEELKKRKLVFEYKVKGQRYYWVVNFKKHQSIDKPQTSQLPNPSIDDQEFRQLLFDLCDGTCIECGREMLQQSQDKPLGYSYPDDFDHTTLLNGTDSRVMSVDHINPKSNGGNNAPHNLRAICISCNKRKHTTIPLMVDEHSDSKDKEKDKEKEESIHPLRRYVLEKHPHVSRLKEQLTNEQCENLITKHGKEAIDEILLAMENYKPLTTKNQSVYLTANNWLNRRKQDSTTSPNEPKKPWTGR